ncbi:hypothetical protein ACAS46_002738 [Vibrio vulnificus]
MNVEDLNNKQLKQEYERVIPLISPYLPVFIEQHKREVNNIILSATNVKQILEYKNIYSYLDKLANSYMEEYNND